MAYSVFHFIGYFFIGGIVVSQNIYAQTDQVAHPGQPHCKVGCEVECPDYLKKLSESCRNYKAYACLKKKYSDKHNGVDIDKIPYFLAKRLIEKDTFNATINNQIREGAEYLDPSQIYEPAPKTWNHWIRGHSTLDKMIEMDQKSNKIEFTVEKLEQIHKVVIDKEIGGRIYALPIIGHLVVAPGNIKRGIPRIMTGFPASEGDITQEDVDTGNLAMLHDPEELYMQVIGNQITFPGTQDMRRELEMIFSKSNNMIENMRKGKEGPFDLDPLDIIAETQKRLTMLHPFHEGVGRTSRFYQDYVTKILCLPPIPGGELQNDMFSSLDQYKKDTRQAVRKNLELMEKCTIYDEEVPPLFICQPGPAAHSENQSASECSDNGEFQNISHQKESADSFGPNGILKGLGFLFSPLAPVAP